MKKAIKTITTIGTVVQFGKQAYEVYGKAKSVYEDRLCTISISEDDRYYIDVTLWLNSLIEEERMKNMTVRVKRNYDSPDQVLYFSDSNRAVVTEFNGEWIRFYVSGKKGIEEDNDGDTKMMPSKLIIQARNQRAIEAIKQKIEDIVSERDLKENPPTLNIFGKWSSWYRARLPIRPIEAVALDRGVKEDIVADLEKFLESEKRYVERGLDWHRGYLLHGPPGTGKTSLVKSLAGMFRINVYFLSLNDVKNDTELIALMSDVDPRSIVLLEDIDSMFSGNRDVQGDGVTMAGLLNVLDGLCTPHGMICIMTTNHPEKLDPALVRPGRIDVQIELSYATQSQVNEHYSYFYGLPERDYVQVPEKHTITMSQVAEVTKSYMDQPDVALQKIKELW